MANNIDYYTFDISKSIRPHCDQWVTHAPNACSICDEYAKEEQQYRIDNNINFTGEHDPTKKPCPAEVLRNINTINKWHGNTPKQSGEKSEQELILEEALKQELEQIEKEQNFDFDKYYGIKK